MSEEGIVNGYLQGPGQEHSAVHGRGRRHDEVVHGVGGRQVGGNEVGEAYERQHLCGEGVRVAGWSA